MNECVQRGRYGKMMPSHVRQVLTEFVDEEYRLPPIKSTAPPYLSRKNKSWND